MGGSIITQPHRGEKERLVSDQPCNEHEKST